MRLTSLSICTDDVPAAVAKAADAGATVLAGPQTTDWGTESAYLQGPDRIVVELLRPAA